MIPLTKVEGVPHRQDVIPGMAYFAGTGPAETTCKTCKFRGYHRKSRHGKWYQTNACEKFRVLSGGKHGRRLRPETPSCKYYEAK